MSQASGVNRPCPCGSGKKFKRCCGQANLPNSRPQALPPTGNAVSAFPVNAPPPTAAECNQLAALFNAGRFQATEEYSQDLLRRYPNSGFLWKVLGAALQVQGKDAISAMQRAIQLMPDDAGARSNLGNAMLHLGRYDAAVDCYRQALVIQPDLAESYFNLGLARKALGLLDKAILLYQRALAIRADYVEAHNNLGNALRQNNQKEDAVASYRTALLQRPAYIDAHNNLVYALRDLGSYDEATRVCRRALAIKPDHAETYNNLGYVHCDLGELELASKAYQRVLAIDPAGLGSGAACWLAVLYYLKGDVRSCRDMLIASPEVKTINTAEYKHARNYRNYIALLLPHFAQQETVSSQEAECETLHVIGESHSLSSHGFEIEYRERKMRAKASWILGCKQWHLGNDRANRFKDRFASIASAIPRGSTLLLTIGEIDCRPDEGIIKVCQKNTAKSLADVALATVNAYVAYVSRVISNYGHRAIICGVPATNVQLESLPPETAQQLVALIRIFNANLKKKVLEAKMDFLDVYTMTDCGDGISSGAWHLDTHHLQPNAMLEAFAKHCIHSS